MSAPPLQLLTTAPVAQAAGLLPATSGGLRRASGLLVPHDGLPAADLREKPERWALLHLLTQAVRRGVPVLAWGSGAALAGRALGAPVHAGSPEWSDLPRGATAHRWQGAAPLHWSAGRVTAWASAELPAAIYDDFVASLPGLSTRRAANPLEELGGEAALRPLLDDFYRQARADALLGPVFAAHVHDWDAHLDRVTAFWATMLGGHGWRGNLNTVHAGLGLRRAHLERWLELFAGAARRHLPPEQAEQLLGRAAVMARRLGKAPGRRGAGTELPHETPRTL